MTDADKSQLQAALSAYITEVGDDEAAIRAAINEVLRAQKTGLTVVPSAAIGALHDKINDLVDILP